MTGRRRTVRHRWNLPPGRQPPQPGQILRGASMARAWTIIEVRPIESAKYPNAWMGTLEPMPWKPGDRFDAFYPSAAERAAEARTSTP